MALFIISSLQAIKENTKKFRMNKLHIHWWRNGKG